MTSRLRHFGLSVLACLAAMAAAVPVAAQGVNPPFLVLDVNPGPADGASGSFSAIVGDIQYFVATDPEHGMELWRTDGTPEGTRLVKDINPGPAHSWVRYGVVVGDAFYFFADTASTGSELWRSDGTEPGTTLVKDVRPGPASSVPNSLTLVGDRLFFHACDATAGCELWTSDGTEAGTTMVKDIWPGPASGVPWALILPELGGRVFFQADDGVTGAELWASDGTEAGTVLVKDIDPRPVTVTQGRSFPSSLTRVGDEVLFFATDPAAGRELWKTDGTPAGTVLVKDIWPGAASSFSSPTRVMTAGGKLFFPARDPAAGGALFASDGTAAGTILLHDFAPAGPSDLDMLSGADLDGVLIFSPQGLDVDTELWRSDGTPQGTVLVRNLNASESSRPEFFQRIDGFVYFDGNDGILGAELWRTDGTSDGTVRVADVNPGSASGNGIAGGKVNGLVLFAAQNPTYGWELWAFDPNAPPIADAGPDQQVVLGEDVILDGSGSSDPEGEPLNYEWRDSFGALAGSNVTLTVALPVGDHVYTLTVDDGVKSASDEVIVHVVAEAQATLEVAGTEGGAGSVSTDPPSPPCANTPGAQAFCAIDLPTGTLATLIPQPAPGSTFVGWSGACSGTGSCQVEIEDSLRVKATFRGPRTLDVTVMGEASGLGSVTVTPPGASCAMAGPGLSQACSYPFGEGQLVTLTATAGPQSGFQGWLGACTGTGPCVITMSEHRSVTARFAGQRLLSMFVNSVEDGTGAIRLEPPNALCELTTPGSSQFCEQSYGFGEVVTLTPVPTGQSVFGGWMDGPCVGMTGPCQVTMSEHTALGARFLGPRRLGVYVATVEGGLGAIRVDPPDALCELPTSGFDQFCEYTYTQGDMVTLTPIPAGQSVFGGWMDGPCVGMTGPCQVTVSEHTALGTRFLGPRRLTVDINGTDGGLGGVRVDPPGELCAITAPGLPQSCQYSYTQGDVVTLTPEPGPQSAFVGWIGACSGSGSCQLTMSEHLSAMATFERVNSAPVAHAGGPYTAVRGQPIDFDDSGSFDPDGDALTYWWDFGDGTSGPGPIPAHAYTSLGTFTATLVVSDGELSSAPAYATVTITNIAPNVALTSPPAGAVFALAPVDVALQAEAADADGSVVLVEFFAGAVKIGESAAPPYAIVWPGVGPGAYLLTARATDDSGASTVSAPVPILVNASPTVTIVEPAPGAVFTAPASITVTAAPSDADGSIVLVKFYEGSTLLGEASASPYSVVWANVPAGPHTITAVAVDDRGATGTASVQVVVNVPDVELAPTADSYVRDGYSSNNNFGTALTLEVQKAPGTGSNRWTYLKFDTSAVGSVSSVRLRLFGNLSAVTGTTVRTQVFSVSNTTWSETGIKWNNKPSVGSTALDVETIANDTTAGRWYEWDVTTYVQQEKAAGRHVISLALKNDAYSGPRAVFRSRQSAFNRPELMLVP